MKKMIEYNKAIDDVHSVLADFYDEKLEENEVNAKRNYSRIIRELKERIEKLKLIKSREVK